MLQRNRYWSAHALWQALSVTILMWYSWLPYNPRNEQSTRDTLRRSDAEGLLGVGESATSLSPSASASVERLTAVDNVPAV